MRSSITNFTIGPAALLSMSLLAGCGGSSSAATVIGFEGDDYTVEAPGLDECDEAASTKLSIDPERPLVVIVHGCNASGGRFRALAQVFEAHGQQTVCFNYDDRERMEETSRQLAFALETVAAHLDPQPVTVLGHSQGGLVSRRALAGKLHSSEGGIPARYKLVTVSSPFDGIRASSHCASIGLHVATLGISALLCQMIAGDKWNEIHPKSDFMRAPGNLGDAVEEHLVVVTDERDTCRRRNDRNRCVEDDFVFSVEEQINDLVEEDDRVARTLVKAGHVEIVGDEGTPPEKLIEVLQERGVMEPTPEEKREEIAALIRRLF